jgi:hypothetical protein
MRLVVIGLAVVLGTFCSVGSLARADVSFDFQIQADFELAFLSNTPFNDTDGMTPFMPFQAFGPLTFTLSNDVETESSAEFTNLTGQLDAGTEFYISPNLEFIGGELTNIVRNGSDIVSASVDNLSARWEMVVDPLGTPVRLFTKVGLPFSGDIDDFQNPEGAVISGLDPFEVYLDDGGDGTLVAIGQNRTLTIVPEPGAFALFGVLGIGLLAVMRRRR